MVQRRYFLGTLLSGMIAMAYCQAAEYPHPSNIFVSNAWAALTTARADSAVAHVTVTNRANKPDRLESALSPVARSVELKAEAAAQGDTSIIAPGKFRDLHLSLTGINQGLPANKRFPLVLIFENAGVIRIDIRLRAADEKGS